MEVMIVKLERWNRMVSNNEVNVVGKNVWMDGKRMEMRLNKGFVELRLGE